MVLSASLCAQNYSDEITLVSQNDNSVTVRATAASEKKKDAVTLAVKSAFNALFHSGVEGVKNGQSMMPSEAGMTQAQRSYDYRFFNEERYLNYIAGEVNTVGSEKFGGKQRVTVELTIKTKAVCTDLSRNHLTLNPGWVDAKAVKATAAVNPTIVIIPYMNANEGNDFAAMRVKAENSPAMRYAIDALAKGFQQNGYKTRDFVNMLQNSQMAAVLRSDAQTDDATMLAQQLPGDIVVSVQVEIESAGGRSQCNLGVRAIEKQTSGQLATETFASGQYLTTDTMELAKHSLAKINASFFSQIQQAFENIIKNGREVGIEMNISEGVTDWDFEQDAPATGDFFKDALEEWLREYAFQGQYDMSVSTDKYINVRVNIPIWNAEKNRSYTLSNFGSDLRKFFKAQLGEDYKASVKAMGQKLSVIIE